MDLITGTELYLQSAWLPYYYFIVIICALYVVHKFNYKAEAIFIVLLFTEGFFSYLGTQSYLFTNIYKIGFSLFAFWLYWPSLKYKKSKLDLYFIIIFILIGIVYIISFYINDSDLLTMLSQYIKKYGIPFLFYFGVKRSFNNEQKMEWYANLFLWLLGFQILFQFFKLLFWGFGESLVGSITFQGGAAGNIIPILGFLIIWIKRKGILQKKDWIFIVLLLLSLAVIGNKRSIWFTMTFMVLYTHLIVGNTVKNFKIIRVIPLIIILFIIGVKANPTLNPENSRWGSFNSQYLIDYTIDYTFGGERTTDDFAHGRGGGALNYFNKPSFNINSAKYLFGYGIEEVVIQDYESFNIKKYGVSSKGSAGAFVQNFIALGILGTLFIFLFGYLIVKNVKNIKMFWGIFIFIVFDYFLFYNSTITINADALLFVFICFYFNFKFSDTPYI